MRQILSYLILSIILISAFFVARGQEAESSVTCPGFVASRLIVGQQGRNTPGAANNIRNSPSVSGELIGEIPGAATFLVLDGPACSDGFAWWQVDYNGLIGWTVEGSGEDYWLEPIIVATPSSEEISPVEESNTCPGFLASRLVVGQQGRVTPGAPNNVRSEPSGDSELIGQIPGGATFTILEGPICGNNRAWWRVSFEGFLGWTLEGAETTYWVEPQVNPSASVGASVNSDKLPISSPVADNPLSPQALTLSNVSQITPLSEYGLGVLQKITWLPDSAMRSRRPSRFQPQWSIAHDGEPGRYRGRELANRIYLGYLQW